MSIIEKIEKEIASKRSAITELQRSTTKDLHEELLSLEREKRRLARDQNKIEQDQLKKLMPLISKITREVILITSEGKFTLWIDFSGHVKWFRIRGHKGPWHTNRDDTIDMTCGLEIKTEESGAQAKKRLLEILEELNNLKSQEDW